MKHSSRRLLQQTFILIIIFSCIHARAGIFDPVKQVQPEKRADTAGKIFRMHVQAADSLTAYTALNELLTWAKAEKDHRLACNALLLLAEYEQSLQLPRSNDKKIVAFYEEAKSIAASRELAVELARCYHAMGAYYYYRQQYGVAFNYLQKANERFNKLGLGNVPDIYRILMDLGFIYYDFDDHDNALRYLREATNYSPGNSWQEKMTLTAIGLIYRKREQYDSAMHFFESTLQVAKQDSDSTWIGIASGNIGSVLMFQKKYEEAIPYLQADVRLCARAGEWASSAGSMIRLAAISSIQKNYALAAQQLHYADTMTTRINDLNRHRDLYYQYAIVYEQLNETDKALLYRKKYEQVKDTLDRQYSRKVYSDAQIRIASERHLSNIKLLEAEKRSALIKRNSLIVFLLLGMIILFLLLNRQRMRRKSAQAELAGATQLMASYTENIRQKNELIEQFKTEIAHLQSRLAEPLDSEKTEALEKLLNSVILTEDDWRTFRDLFDKVHKGFIVRLRQRLPDLTQAETRLVTLTRLSLSDREMAGMLGISIDTVRKTRQRLRRKLSSSEQGTFEELVLSI